MNTKTMLGVMLKKLTKREIKKLEQMDLRNKSHLSPFDKFYTQVCFPELTITMKDELVKAEVHRLVHYAECKSATTAQCILMLTPWDKYKAPDHPIGKCPFVDYL